MPAIKEVEYKEKASWPGECDKDIHLSVDGRWFLDKDLEGSTELSHKEAMLWLRHNRYYETILRFAFRLRPEWRLAAWDREPERFDYTDEEEDQLHELAVTIFFAST